jgi:NAD+ synthase
MEQLANKLTDWIRERVLAARKLGVTLGLSGGIDSAVVAVLCKRAFPDTTLAVIMPCHSVETDIEHAKAVAKKYRIYTEIFDLQLIFESLVQTLPSLNGRQDNEKLTLSNVKPRLRMITLYYLAAQLDYLVVGTGNRSELSVGYFTKYGDGGVDIMPLANLVKQQVTELAIYLDIPNEIVQKPPSAGLWEGQTDEGELGMTYKDLDRYLTMGEADSVVKQRIESLNAASAHKRAMPQVPPF